MTGGNTAGSHAKLCYFLGAPGAFARKYGSYGLVNSDLLEKMMHSFPHPIVFTKSNKF